MARTPDDTKKPPRRPAARAAKPAAEGKAKPRAAAAKASSGAAAAGAKPRKAAAGTKPRAAAPAAPASASSAVVKAPRASGATKTPRASGATKAPRATKSEGKPSARARAAAPAKRESAAKPAPAKRATTATLRAKPRAAVETPAPRPAAKSAAAKPRPTATPRRKGAKRVPMDRDRLAALVAAAVKSLEDDKAEDVVVLDVTGRASFTDRMVIATGLVERQIEAMAAHLTETLAKEGLRLRRDAVQASDDWVVIDAGDLVIHLFKPEARLAYDLEKMWGPDSPLGEAPPGEQSPI